MFQLMIVLRSVARRLGLNVVLGKVKRAITGSRYEMRFDDMLTEACKPGDTVWDVGANVGYYTPGLSKQVGVKGKVVAFEPAPPAFSALTAVAKPFSNVDCMNVALGQTSGTCEMWIDSGNPTSPFARVSGGAAVAPSQGHKVSVPLKTADEIAVQIGTPHVVKIDVEGQELNVLQGMTKTLKSPTCRAIFLEVHFTILEENGNKFAPVEIKQLLKDSGFTTFRWADASHLVATK